MPAADIDSWIAHLRKQRWRILAILPQLKSSDRFFMGNSFQTRPEVPLIPNSEVAFASLGGAGAPAHAQLRNSGLMGPPVGGLR